jgi:hypothetical protein
MHETERDRRAAESAHSSGGGHGGAGHGGGAHGRGTSAGYEQTDVKPRGIVIFLIGLAIVVALSLVAMRFLFDAVVAREVRRDARATQAAAPAASADRIPPEPRLQTAVRSDLDALRAHEDSVLTRYGWVSREAGVVRIPIDRAIELLAERGLPARAPSTVPRQAGSAHDTPPRDSNSGRPAERRP